MTTENRRKALLDFIATAKPVLCAYCGSKLVNGKCPSGCMQFRSGDQVITIWLDDPDGSLARWADDGGR